MTDAQAPADPRAHLTDLASFLSASPSSLHAVAESARRLREGGFVEVAELDEWPTGAGAYLTVRDGAIVAWVIPHGATPATPFRIIGAHTDSPGFRLKPRPTRGTLGWLQAGVEVYGGPLLNSWLDRELELAGRLVFCDGSTELVRTGPLLRFPQLAVHLDRGVNSEGLRLDPQQHMTPIFGVGEVSGADLVDLLAQLSGRRGADVAGYDISVADTAAPQVFGVHDELFAAGRLDNLSSVHAGVSAIIGHASSVASSAVSSAGASADPPAIAVFAAFDHEEVGSASISGAAGPMLETVLQRIGAQAGGVGSRAGGSRADGSHADGSRGAESERARALAGSWVLSSDAGHAVHPNYPERHDPVNRPIVNAGPLLKINANQRYATDGPGAAEWARVCDVAGVPYQEFVSNNSVPCGSTIGPISATRLGVRTIDVGIALLSMHSARELCGADDPAHLTAAMAAFLAG